jgi:hypothetical protein
MVTIGGFLLLALCGWGSGLGEAGMIMEQWVMARKIMWGEKGEII